MSNEKDIRVIRILNNKELLINIGKDTSVEKGDLFQIFEIGEDIIDPLTNKKLGRLDYVKAVVEAVTVYDGFSKVQSLSRRTETTIAGVMSAFNNHKKISKITEVNELPVESEQINDTVVKNKNIALDDPVRKIEKA